MATDTIPKPRLTGLGAIQLHFDRERKQLGDRYRDEMAAAATRDEREQLTDTYLGARYALQADEERALSRHFALYPDQWRSRGKPLRELVRWRVWRQIPDNPHDEARRTEMTVIDDITVEDWPRNKVLEGRRRLEELDAKVGDTVVVRQANGTGVIHLTLTRPGETAYVTISKSS